MNEKDVKKILTFQEMITKGHFLLEFIMLAGMGATITSVSSSISSRQCSRTCSRININNNDDKKVNITMMKKKSPRFDLFGNPCGPNTTPAVGDAGNALQCER